jgi:multicomponent Na+:H+ antiporter subunit E
MKKNKIIYKRDFLVLVLSLFIFWILLTFDFSYSSLILGLLISILISVPTSALFKHKVKIKRKKFREYFYAIEHLIGLISSTVFRVTIANIQLIYQTISLKINPRIVRIKVDLRSDAELALISHLITLTPGTLVIDVQDADDKGSYIYVHFSYLSDKDPGEYIGKTIGRWDEMIGALFK